MNKTQEVIKHKRITGVSYIVTAPTFLQISSKKVEKLISRGALVRAGGLENFSKKISGGHLFGT